MQEINSIKAHTIYKVVHIIKMLMVTKSHQKRIVFHPQYTDQNKLKYNHETKRGGLRKEDLICMKDTTMIPAHHQLWLC